MADQVFLSNLTGDQISGLFIWLSQTRPSFQVKTTVQYIQIVAPKFWVPSESSSKILSSMVSSYCNQTPSTGKQTSIVSIFSVYSKCSVFS
jgi:hypothetical protein